MKNPHTLRELRDLHRRAEMVLTREGVKQGAILKKYRELVSVSGVGEVPYVAPDFEQDVPLGVYADEVRQQIWATLNRHEKEAAREWNQ